MKRTLAHLAALLLPLAILHAADDINPYTRKT